MPAIPVQSNGKRAWRAHASRTGCQGTNSSEIGQKPIMGNRSTAWETILWYRPAQSAAVDFRHLDSCHPDM